MLGFARSVNSVSRKRMRCTDFGLCALMMSRVLVITLYIASDLFLQGDVPSGLSRLRVD